MTFDLAERLYPYIGGIVRAEKGMRYDIDGVEDHIHVYLRRSACLRSIYRISR